MCTGNSEGDMMPETIQDSLTIVENTGNSNVNLIASGTESQLRLESSGNPLQIAVATTGASIGTVNAFPLTVQTNGEARIFIEADGDVGIGTTSPGAKLAIDGDLKLQAGVTVNKFSSDVNLTENNDQTLPTSRAAKTYIDSKITQVSSALTTGLATKAALAGSTSQDFSTRSLSVSGTLTVTGNVGIGTSSPAAPLHVASYIAVGPFAASTGTGGLDVTGPTAELGFVRRSLTAWPTTPVAGDRYVWYNGNGTATLWTEQRGDLFSVSSTGNVGIGTNAPVAPLHIAGGNWNPNDTDGDVRLGDATYKFKIGIARGGGGAGDVRLRAQGGTNRIMIGGGTSDALFVQNNEVSIPTGKLSFGAQVRQMINLWSQEYGIGVQAGTQYFRTGDNFCWFRGGVHNDNRDNPGGGIRLMALNGAGDLILSARTNPTGSPSGSLCRALVDLNRKLVINLDNDYANGVDIVNGRFVSSRKLKENIQDLSTDAAIAAFKDLNPVTFHYKTDDSNHLHVGFIAEEVPDLVASYDRRSIGPMDVLAVLTKVLQTQQATITELTEKVRKLESHKSLP